MENETRTLAENIVAHIDIQINEHAEYDSIKYDEDAKKIVDARYKNVDFIVGNAVLSVNFELLDDCVRGEAMFSWGRKYFNGKTLFEAKQEVIDFIAEQEVKRIIRKIENGAKTSIRKNNELSTSDNVVYSYRCL